MERVAGIEPASSAWKAEVLPLNYTRNIIAFLLCLSSLKLSLNLSLTRFGPTLPMR